MIQITTVVVATVILSILEQAFTARNRAETPKQFVRATLPRSFEVSFFLLAGVLFFVILAPPNWGAEPRPPQGRSGMQKKDAAVEAGTPLDSVTVPDGTPLALELVESFTSATAKVGDAVKFATPYPTRVNGLVIVPSGVAVSGTVAHVSPARRPVRNGQVKVAIEKLILPSGELVTLRLRKSGSRKPQGMADEGHQIGLGGLLWRAPFDPLTAVIALPIAMAAKGDDLVYSAGTRVTVYFDGPLNLNRGALLKLQPPTYKGPAQVFFKNRRNKAVKLFCGQKFVGDLFYPYPVQLELNPGTYTFRTGKTREKAAQLVVLEDHQYWIERDRGGLFVKDSQQHLREIEELSAYRKIDRDFAMSSMADSCAQVAQP